MPTTPFSEQRLKYAATVNDEALSESTDADFELAYIDIGNVDSQGRVHDIVNYRFEDAPSRARRIVRDGDVIISTVRTYLQAIAPVENPPDNLIVSTGFAVVRPSNLLDHRFCKYALRASKFLWEVESRSTGVSYPAINASDLGDIKVSLPEISAQQLIADYLDRETARIDGLIAQKERMLALLDEKRAALISRVVTRGLDSNAPLKASGQEWLGEIPAHWPTTKFSWDVFISEGQVDPEDDHFSEMVLIAPNHIESRTGQVIYKETSADQGAISGKYLCKEGDVIYSKIRPALRKVALADEDCLCSADMYALRPSERLLPQYLQYFLLSEDFSTWAELESARVAMPKINRETLSAIRIPVPPIQEQERIISEIRRGTERIDLQRRAIRVSVELLKERRAALITAAATGQIPLEEMTR
jgi:type I restriction enzyme S subunit